MYQPKKINIGDRVTLKKNHPCGGNQFGLHNISPVGGLLMDDKRSAYCKVCCVSKIPFCVKTGVFSDGLVC